MLAHGLSVLEERVGLDEVIVVKKRDKVAGGALDAGVGVTGDAEVLLERDAAYPLIIGARPLNEGRELGVFR